MKDNKMDPAQEIELIALARQNPMNNVIDLGDSPVQQFYSGTTIFVTGGSGFIGKQLIEKLFRSCAIEKMYLLMRPKKSRTIQERLSYMLQNPYMKDNKMDPAQEIELIALARQNPMNNVIDLGDSPVQQFYSGTTIFVTGGSGFIGKQLIEKLFRSCAIEKMYLLMRPKKSRTIQERLSYMLQNPYMKDNKMDPAQEIELIALARQNPMNNVIDLGDSPVQQFYSGTTIFVTGGSGFIGKQLIEKLFRSCAIEKMYLLMRPKKSRTIQERLSYMLQNPVYDMLRNKKPEFEDKIIPVEGNVADIRLGLSDKDWIMLSNEVNIIFHAAATIRFDELLRKATLTNIRSAREILELARSCKNFKKFVHVSTAFSFATKDRIGKEVLEQFYPCPLPPDTMISLAENVNEKKLDNMTNNLIEGWPNTYTFTKCIAEELVRTKSGDLPVCIVRPSIVLPAYYEPAPGWLDINTIMGPSGIYLGAGLGMLRVFCADVNSNVAIAPVDYVNNTIIAAPWDSTERQKNGETEIPIYTVGKDIRYGFMGEVIRQEKKKLSTPKSVWRTELLEVKSTLLYCILSWFLLYIPAYIMDFICLVSGKRPKEISSFVDIYRKVDKLSVVYNYFTTNAFRFGTDNVKAMLNRMSDADRAIYNCNVSDIDSKDYVVVWGIGIRKYIMKDGLMGTNAAYRKQHIYLVLDYIVMALYAYVLWWICSSVYLFGKYILM